MSAILVAQLVVFSTEIEGRSHAVASDHFQGLLLERVESFHDSAVINVPPQCVKCVEQRPAGINAFRSQAVVWRQIRHFEVFAVGVRSDFEWVV